MQQIAFGPFDFDMERGSLRRNGAPVPVGSKGLRLLAALVRAGGGIVDKDALMQAAWGDTAVEESNLSVQIAALRKILGPAPDGGEWIATVPRVGYRFVGEPAPQARDGAGRADTAKPSIAVLPFVNRSGDGEQEYLADGITEDIITALTRFRWFFVIARNSSFAYKNKPLGAKQIADELGVRYLLEGSLRSSDSRIRISAQLVEAASGTHVWAERYDLERTELFAIQDEIAERVAGAIEPELLKSEGALAAARHTGNMTAWDLVRRGTWHFHQVTRENHLRARELFREATRLDPDLPEAHIWIARVSAGVVPYGWSSDPAADLREGTDAALRAIHLDERNPYAHYALAIVSIFAGRSDQAIRAAEKATDLSPSFALGHLGLGMALLYSGKAESALVPLERGLQLSPYDPQNFVWFNVLALARLFTGNAEAALEAALRGAKVRPNWPTTLEVLICCYIALGRIKDAGSTARELATLPVVPGDVLAPMKAGNPQWAEEMEETLQRAIGKIRHKE